MAYALLDDEWYGHRKVVELSFPARGLWVTVLAWCAHHRGTRGAVTRSVVAYLAAPLLSREAALSLAGELERAELWEPCPDGWQIHDWQDWSGRRDSVVEPVESATASTPTDGTDRPGGGVEAATRPLTRSEVNRANAKARWERSRMGLHPVSHPVASVSHDGSHPMQTGFASGSHDANEGGGGESSDPIQDDPSQNNANPAGVGGGGRIESHPKSHAFASVSHSHSHAGSHPVASHAIASAHPTVIISPDDLAQPPDPTGGIRAALEASPLLVGEDHHGIALAVQTIAGNAKRSPDETREIVGMALESLAGALANKRGRGVELGRKGSYLTKILRGLAAPGGLEAERAKLKPMPQTAPKPAQADDGEDERDKTRRLIAAQRARMAQTQGMVG